MKNQYKNLLLLFQFFLIIFTYHTLKDLKDSLVITASDAGAEVIPFIKIWGMLPTAVLASYFFTRIYQWLGREKTFYFFVTFLISTYLIFAFILYPLRESLYLEHFSNYLHLYLPSGAKGFIAMIAHWPHTLFYLASELWSVLILSILFFSFLNETTTLAEAKKFYPLCMFTGNLAGIVSGQFSHVLCHRLAGQFTWQTTLQILILAVTFCGILIMGINRAVSKGQNSSFTMKKSKNATSFKDQCVSVFSNGKLFCIALLVIGFGLTTNLIEVLWKENIKVLHPTPQAYNAYINQLTSMIGILAVVMALCSKWLFKKLSWTQVALFTPLVLLFTSLLFFCALLSPDQALEQFAVACKITPLHLIVTLGSIYYVLGMTAKYTLFDMTKEMAFLSIDLEERTKAKSIIDSIGSRLGKSGAACFLQFILIAFGSAAGYIPVIALICLSMIGFSIAAVRRLGHQVEEKALA